MLNSQGEEEKAQRQKEQLGDQEKAEIGKKLTKKQNSTIQWRQQQSTNTAVFRVLLVGFVQAKHSRQHKDHPDDSRQSQAKGSLIVSHRKLEDQQRQSREEQHGKKILLAAQIDQQIFPEQD